MAIPNFISGIFGVTEPAIYGILLPLKNRLSSAVSWEASEEDSTEPLISESL